MPQRPRRAAPDRLTALVLLGVLELSLTLRRVPRSAPTAKPGRVAEPARQSGSGWRIPRPLEGSYGVNLAVALLALVPFIVVSTAYALFREQVGHAIGGSRTLLEVFAGEATAAYAFGALLGGDLMQRFRQRRLFLLCEGLFVLGAVLAAVAPGAAAYGTGRVLMGFATGLLLEVALPPVIQTFPARRLPLTVVAVDIGFFGAVCLGGPCLADGSPPRGSGAGSSGFSAVWADWRSCWPP